MDWQRIEELFEAAVELAPVERDRYLTQACDGDDALRREVDELLAADAGSEGFLDEPAARVAGLGALLESTALARPREANAAEGSRGSGRRRRRDFLPTFKAGDVLAERFEIARFLAAGGMGEVYEAQDLELGQRVALKIVRPEIAVDETTMKRFRREVQMARRVTHPSICRCYDIFRHRLPPSPPTAPPWGMAGSGGRDAATAGTSVTVTFLSMELLRGETLTDLLRRKGRLTTDEALPIVRQICEALGAAHDAGVIHRDLKSANVILEDSADPPRVVVTDFGLARPGAVSEAGTALTATGLMLGTPAYMAPEQVREGKLSAATDIYALGVLLFEMVTGRFPFEGDGGLEVATKRLEEPPPRPREIVPDLDAQWQRAILRCLELEPEKRFASCRELLRELRPESGTGRHWLRPQTWFRR